LSNTIAQQSYNSSIISFVNSLKEISKEEKNKKTEE